jgi:hypothetical protein
MPYADTPSANLPSMNTVVGMNIASYVFTDSGPDCDSSEHSDMQPVKAALNNVPTSFPKYYFSKQNMMYNQWQLTGKCNSHGGHTIEPMNIVMWNRYFNLVCNPSSPPAYAPSIPVCVDLGDYTNTNDRCYGGSGPNNDWMDNIFQVCLLTHKNVGNGADPGCTVRVAEQQQQHKQKRRICKLEYAHVATTGEIFAYIRSCFYLFDLIFSVIMRRW